MSSEEKPKIQRPSVRPKGQGMRGENASFAMNKKVIPIATYSTIEREGAFLEVSHGSERVLGLNVVFADVDQMCASGGCEWCDRLRSRIRSRVDPSMMRVGN